MKITTKVSNLCSFVGEPYSTFNGLCLLIHIHPLQISLQSAVTQREAMFSQLSSPVETLEQLKSTLELLHTITDMQSLIDDVYLPVERLYTLLR